MMLVVGLALCFIGAWMFHAPTQPIDRFHGVLVFAIGLAVVVAAALVLRSPPEAILTLSPHGIRNVLLSDNLIPWTAISSVETGVDPYAPVLVRRLASTITVSKAFYDTLGSHWPHASAVSVQLYNFWNPFKPYDIVVDVDGDMVRIPIARRLRAASARQMQREIESRWRAFGGEASRS